MLSCGARVFGFCEILDFVLIELKICYNVEKLFAPFSTQTGGPPMRTPTNLTALLLLTLFGCSHPPPPTFDPRLTGAELQLLREQKILKETETALFERPYLELTHLQSFYEDHSIAIHWVSDSTFTCRGLSELECLREDPMDFYVCPITSERIDGDPSNAATYDPQNDILWVSEAEVSRRVRAVMVASELQSAWEHHTYRRVSNSDSAIVTLPSSYLLAFNLLNRDTNCAWGEAVFESARDQERVLVQERLSPEMTLAYGMPGDGWKINVAMNEAYDVDSLDRNYLLFELMVHATMARILLAEARADSIALHPPLELRRLRD